MKATGTLTFTRNPDGSVSHKWEGGRRIAISGELVRQMVGLRGHLNDVYDFNGISLRLVAYEPLAVTAARSYYEQGFTAMRDGWLAHVVAWYVSFAFNYAALHADVGEGEDIPKWSLTGLLLRWV